MHFMDRGATSIVHMPEGEVHKLAELFYEFLKSNNLRAELEYEIKELKDEQG